MTPLTEKQLEAAAREYCKLVGADPDTRVPHGAKPDANGYIPAVLLYSPQWQLVAEHLRTRDLETIALSVGRESGA